MLPLIVAVFTASLLGSLHCIGMCGPLAMMASGVGINQNSKSRSWKLWLAYHGGRLVAYAGLGGVAGAVGASIHQTGNWLGLQQLAAKFAGGSMLVVGLLTLVHLTQGASHRLWVPKRFQAALATGHAWARRQPPLRRAGAIGILTALLPCGWLYAFLLVAAGTASIASGAMVMAVFSLGSVPALVGLVASTGWLVGRTGKIIPWFSAILVTVVGGVTLVQRSHIDPTRQLMPQFGEAPTTLVNHVEKLDHHRMPCCEAKINDQATSKNAPSTIESAKEATSESTSESTSQSKSSTESDQDGDQVAREVGGQ